MYDRGHALKVRSLLHTHTFSMFYLWRSRHTYAHTHTHAPSHHTLHANVSRIYYTILLASFHCKIYHDDFFSRLRICMRDDGHIAVGLRVCVRACKLTCEWCVSPSSSLPSAASLTLKIRRLVRVRWPDDYSNRYNHCNFRRVKSFRYLSLVTAKTTTTRRTTTTTVVACCPTQRLQ